MHADNELMGKPPRKLRERLAELREERGWSQAELARLAGLSSTTVSRIESGDRVDTRWDTIMKLASALGVEPEDLTGEQRPAPRVVRLPVGDGSDADVAAGRITGPELLHLYIGSTWWREDRPTHEEIEWLSGLADVLWTGRPPTAATAHALIMQRRAGSI